LKYEIIMQEYLLINHCNESLIAVDLFEAYSKDHNTRELFGDSQSWQVLRFSLFLSAITGACELHNLIKNSPKYSVRYAEICNKSYKKIQYIRQGAVHVHNNVHKIEESIGSRATFNTVVGKGRMGTSDGKPVGTNEYHDDILIVYGDCELHVVRDLKKVLLSMREILAPDSRNVAV